MDKPAIKTRFVLLEIEESKADELVAALLQRSYIKLADVNILSTRLRVTSCPACLRQFTRISYKTVDEALLWDLLALLRGMSTQRSVCFYETESEIRPVDKERFVKFSAKSRKMCEILGLTSMVTDGSTATYHMNTNCIKFLKGELTLRPAVVAIADGGVLDVSGELHIDQVQSKDKEASLNGLKQSILEAIRKLPEATLNFVRSGQTTLI